MAIKENFYEYQSLRSDYTIVAVLYAPEENLSSSLVQMDNLNDR